MQIELKLRYKFRLILDETWSFGVLGRTGRGITEHQNIDAAEVDMIVGSLAGPICAGGGFCAGSDEIVEHQRLSSASYTFSAALPAMLATTASETLIMLQTTPDILTQARENTKTMWAQLDPRSDWVYCTSSVENPMMILVLKPEVVASKKLSLQDQEQLLQDAVDEVRKHFRSLGAIRFTDSVLPTVSCQRRAHHPVEEHAPGRQCQGHGMGGQDAAGPQGLHHQRAIEERGGAGGDHHQTCHHQGSEPEEVIRGAECLLYDSGAM